MEEQLKKVQKAARGGKGQGARQNDLDRWMQWKKEKAKMQQMAKKKKEECWRRFTEEYGERDPWEVARLARDPWRLQFSMQELNDNEGNPLITDREKAEALGKRHFHWDKDGRQLEDTEAEEGGREIEELGELEEERVTPSYSKEELKSKLRKAL